ncbi:MAG: AMP-binding protein [Bacteroidaceae bacterium]|nr:AMP-binding protein [Bacteroidaceae bacterium]
MKHFLSYVDEAIKANWERSALSNYGANTYTYKDVASEIEKLHILFEKCGIAKGEKIALCARNSAEWCISYFAIVSYDAVCVPLLADFLPQNIADLTRLSDSRLLLVDKSIFGGLEREKIVPQFAGFADFVGLVDICGLNVLEDCNGKLTKITSEIGNAYARIYPKGLTPADVNYAKEDIEALAVISYTSGTSSSPKGVMLTARSISSNVEFARTHIPATAGDTILSILPLAHIFGQIFDFVYPFTCGCHINIFTEKPIPARLLKALADVKPYMFLTVPLLIEKIFRAKVMPQLQTKLMRVLLHIPGLKGVICNKVRAKLVATFGGNVAKGGIILGGAALNKEVENVMKMIKLPYSVGYGMTECGPLLSYKRWQDFVIRSCGAVAHPGVEIRIDSEKPSRIPGEIQARGASVMSGYYKNEEATKATFTSDGWLKTGDMGLMDKHENIFIKGRCKNMILTANGQNIYPEEIEDLVNQLPLVMESIIVGRKHGLVAIVVPNADAVAEAGISEVELKKNIEESLFELNAKLPVYSKITACELKKEPFEKTPKLSIKRFMYK